MPLYDNILKTIGRTPVVRINRLAPKHVDLFVKCEFFNPLSSVKDRLALAVIEDAEQRGLLRPGMTVCEATSGNTGIALAMVCAAKGYPLVLTMAESFSVERRKLMRQLGAKLVLTPAALGGKGMVEKAKELAQRNGWFLTDQFNNPANPRFHANTTAPEILADFAGRRLDYWVTGWGTGGTLIGAGKVLRSAREELRVVVSEPEGAALLSGGQFQPHKVQGWTPNFVPGIIDQGKKNEGKVWDSIVKVKDEEAIHAAKELARKEGIFCGISAGGTFAAALKTAEQAPEGSTILAMLPDTGERYLSTALFADIHEGSDQVE
ncbi:cysteine synthase [Balamuthia mandrillaris]